MAGATVALADVADWVGTDADMASWVDLSADLAGGVSPRLGPTADVAFGYNV